MKQQIMQENHGRKPKCMLRGVNLATFESRSFKSIWISANLAPQQSLSQYTFQTRSAGVKLCDGFESF